MLTRCRKCDEVLKEGDIVRVVVDAEYHELKSRVHFAISNITDADASTMEHRECITKED